MMKKRIVSFLLSLCMIFSIVPTHIFADDLSAMSFDDAEWMYQGSNWVDIYEEGEIKYYIFTPDMDGDYTFYSTGSMSPVYCNVYDESYSPISGAPGGSNYDGIGFRFTYYFTAGMTYYLEMGADDGMSTGGFDVYIEYGSDVGGGGEIPDEPQYYGEMSVYTTYEIPAYVGGYGEFTPAETGIYAVSFNDMYAWVDLAGFRIESPYQTPQYYLLRADEMYSVNAMGYDARSDFYIYPVATQPLDELKANETLNIHGERLSYVEFTPETSGSITVDVLSDNDEAYYAVALYGIEEFSYYSCYEGIIEADVTEGQTYYLVLDDYEYSIEASFNSDIELNGVDITANDILGGKEFYLSTADDATIYYSTDNVDFYVYGNTPVQVKEDTTMYAYTRNGSVTSETSELSVTVPKANTPVPSHQSGSYFMTESVSFTAEENVEIFYRYNDEDWEFEYTTDHEPFAVTEDFDITVYAIGYGIAKSDELKLSYKVVRAEKPTVTITDIMGGKRFSASTDEEGAQISGVINEYTLFDYTEPIDIYEDAKISVKASLENAFDSDDVVSSITLDAAQAPVSNYPSGEIFTGTKILLTSDNDGGETQIYYTTDGTDPDMESATLYTDDGITLTEDTTLRVRAYAMGRKGSEIAEFNYTIKGIKKPVITENNTEGGKEITITTSDTDVELYYSIDGESYKLYEGSIFIETDTTVRAYAKQDEVVSEIEEVTFTVPKAQTPQASHADGEYRVGTAITLTSADGVTIKYELDGNTYTYTEPIVLLKDTEITAYAIGEGVAKSEQLKLSYTVFKTAAPILTESDIMGGMSVSIAATTEGASIYVSIDGGEFVQYTEPLNFYDYADIEAYAKSDGALDSPIVKYNVTMLQAAAPNPNYASGELFLGTIITLESYNDGVETEIYYTTDGTEPDNTKTRYTGAFAINNATTIKACAYAMGRAVSDTAVFNYTIKTAIKPKIEEESTRGGKRIYLTSTTPSSTIYYTLDGTNPKESDTKLTYESPFIIGVDGTVVKAYAVSDKYLDSAVTEYTVEIGQLSAPVFRATASKLYLNETIEITTESFADIRYTTDGSEPDENSTLYTAPISIMDDTVIKAIAVSEGWKTSIVSEASYSVYVTATPAITKTKQGNCMSIVIKSDTPDAVIYYTTDGSIPDTSSAVYTEEILLSADTTIKTFAVSENRKDSSMYEETILVRHTDAPVANPASGLVKLTDTVTLTAKESAKIYYTTDQTEPTEESTLYTEPITLTDDTVIKAFAAEDGYLDSNVVTYEYIIEQTANPEISFGEDIWGGKTLVISSSTEGAEIYYTLDGTEPTINSTLYTGPVDLLETAFVRAMAVCEGYKGSDIISKEMVVPVAPISTYGGYTYVKTNEYLNVSLSPQTVYYTLDGSEPTSESAVYQPGTLMFPQGGTIKAYAIGTGYAKSKVISLRVYNYSASIYFTIEHGDGYADIQLTSVDGATILYTTDESDPQTEGTVYTEPIRITGTTTINVYAYAEGYRSSTNSRTVYVNRADAPEFSVSQPCHRSSIYYYTISGTDIVISSPQNLKIRYTTDGSIPSAENGIEYTSPLKVDGECTIRAYCYGDTYEDSEIKTIYIEMAKSFGQVRTEDVENGKEYKIVPKYGAGADIPSSSSTIATAYFKNYTIYYTTDGTEPTENSPVYLKVVDGEITEAAGEAGENEFERKLFTSENVTVKTLVVADGCVSGDIYTEEIEVLKLNAPSFTPAETQISAGTEISLQSGDESASIYYTTDGTTPTTSSTLYTEPFVLNESATVKAIAVKYGMANSDVASLSYEIKQTKTPSYTEKMTASGKVITLSCETPDSKIYYTLNGDVPTVNSTLYTEPFKIKKNTTLSFIAVADGLKDSYVVSELIDVPFSEMSVIGLGETVANAGGYVDVPVYVQKNPGVAAYSIMVEYDNSVMTPVSATNNWGGIFMTNIDKGDASNIESNVAMTWLGNVNNYTDGDAAVIRFKANDVAEEQISGLYIKENGVINNLYENVDVAYMNGAVSISPASVALMSMSSSYTLNRSTVYTDTKLRLVAEKTDAETIRVDVMVEENSGINAYNIALEYNNGLVTPVSVENGELFASDVMSNVEQPDANTAFLSNVTVLSCNDTNVTQSGRLFSVYFHIDSLIYTEHEIAFESVSLLNSSGDKVVGVYESATVQESEDVEIFVNSKLVLESNKINNFDIQISSASEYDEAKLIVAVFDDYTKTLVTAKDIDTSLKKGINKIEDVSVTLTGECKNPCVGIYIWNTLDSLVPLGSCKKYFASISE